MRQSHSWVRSSSLFACLLHGSALNSKLPPPGFLVCLQIYKAGLPLPYLCLGPRATGQGQDLPRLVVVETGTLALMP